MVIKGSSLLYRFFHKVVCLIPNHSVAFQFMMRLRNDSKIVILSLSLAVSNGLVFSFYDLPSVKYILEALTKVT